MTQLNFDSTGIEPLQPMTALPRGKYLAAITASEMKATKAADGGEYLQLEFTVLEGPLANRKCWARLNLKNKNTTAEDIARRELAAICHAVGLVRLKDSEELHDRPVYIEVIVETAKDGSENNRIKAYIATDDAGTAKAAATPAPKATGKATPPWAKSKTAA